MKATTDDAEKFLENFTCETTMKYTSRTDDSVYYRFEDILEVIKSALNKPSQQECKDNNLVCDYTEFVVPRSISDIGIGDHVLVQHHSDYYAGKWHGKRLVRYECYSTGISGRMFRNVKLSHECIQMNEIYEYNGKNIIIGVFIK